MADLLRIVTLSQGGRPVQVKDLSYQQGSYAAERDTFKFTPAPPQQQASRSGRRFGGGMVVGESHDNAQASWTALITAATSAQAAINIESMLAEIHAVSRGRLLEWRPDGAAYSSFLRIAGPGTWDPNYRWAEWTGTNTIKVAVSFPVAPLVEWALMTVLDDFAVDSIADYTLSPTGNLAVTGGRLVISTTAARTGLHAARGYSYQDAQVAMKVGIGASGASWSHRVIGRASGTNDYLYAQINQAGQLTVGKFVAGASTTLATATGASVTFSTDRWLRLRMEGDVITAEWWTTEPHPVNTPDLTVSFTLTGSEAQFRSIAGQAGWRAVPGAADSTWTVDDFRVTPYAYRLVTLPERLQLGGAVPGDAPAKADLQVTLNSEIPAWALFAWTSRPGTPVGGVAPFGIIEAETAGNLTGWVSTANASSRGGNDLRDATVVGAESYTASWTIDPHTLVADEFEEEIDLEVWARIIVSSLLVGPRFTLSARPSPGTAVAAERFTHEFGSAGKAVVNTNSGTVYRFARLGTLTLPVSPAAANTWLLWLAASTLAGSTGVIGCDYLIVVPRRARALGPTSVPLDSTYPVFTTFGAPPAGVRRTIRHDLSGQATLMPNNPYPHHGLGGSLIELPPGNVDLLAKVSTLVPDDPTSNGTTEALSAAATVSVDVTPRSFMLRS